MKDGRRNFLLWLAGLVAPLPRFIPDPLRVEGEVNARNWRHLTEEEWRKLRCRVFLDRVEMQQVWYANTDTGVIRTYDVFGDGDPHLVRELKFSPREAMLPLRCFHSIVVSGERLEILDGGLLGRTLRGKVEIRKFEA